MEKLTKENFQDYAKSYREAYEKTSGKVCPPIVQLKTWVKVGDISFRPDEFVQAINNLKDRANNVLNINKDFKAEGEKVDEIQSLLKDALKKADEIKHLEGKELSNIKDELEIVLGLSYNLKARNVV